MTLDQTTEFLEPVDIVQAIAEEMNWVHSRQDADHLVIQQHDLYGEFYQHAGYSFSGAVFFSCTRSLTVNTWNELETLRLLNLINQRVEYGSFFMDFDKDVLLFKIPCDYDDQRPLNQEDIKGLLGRMGEVFSQYYPAFLAITGVQPGSNEHQRNGMVCLDPGASAEEAFDMCNCAQVGHA